VPQTVNVAKSNTIIAGTHARVILIAAVQYLSIEFLSIDAQLRTAVIEVCIITDRLASIEDGGLGAAHVELYRSVRNGTPILVERIGERG
jgi:hypothetical protein